MPFLNNIVDGLNAEIKSKSLYTIPTFDIKQYGISEQYMTKELGDDGKEIILFMPSVISRNADVTQISIDDTYKLTMYHKVESISNGLSTKDAYGDSIGKQLEVANMSLIVFAYRNKINMNAWEIEAYIKDQVNEKVSIKNDSLIVVQSSNIKWGVTSFDKTSILQREYGLIQLNYPDLIAIEMKYRIESIWKKGCFRQCACPQPQTDN